MTFKRNNNNKKYGYEQQQTQIQETAHEMELVIDTFHNTLEVLEEYIGKLNHYPNWDSRRQLYRKKIANSDYTLEGFEDMFLTQLFIVKASVVNKPEFFLKEVQKEFNKWINATGIDANNCPEKLKHFLFEVNEVLEGRGENIVNQTRELIKDRELTTDEALGFFGKLQKPLNKNRERGNLLEGKNWDEAENRNEIGGDFEQGKKTFGQISQGFSSRHAEFDLFSEQKKLRGIQSNNPQQRSNSEIIQDIKNNPQNWRIDEIYTEVGYSGTKQEIVLIHKSAQLDDYDQQGKLNFNGNPIYRADRFNQAELAEVNQVLGISQSSGSTSTLQGQIVKGKVDESTTSNPNNSGSGFGKVVLIGGVLALASLGIYEISTVVKKSKKIKK